jgi:hypothetical protein
MIFNGHTLETISELDDVTMANIQTMYADGMVGNYGVLTQLAPLTDAEKKTDASNSLLAFMTQAQGFDSKLFGAVNG